MAHIQIFLSTVSAEFRSYRDVLCRDLNRPNVTVKVQEDFIATGTETLDKLDEYIRQCEAVIHLVGDMTGAWTNITAVTAIRQRYPDFAERLPVLGPFLNGLSALSYTQWEAWLALYHRKVLIIAAPQDSAPRDARYQRKEDQCAAQQAHLVRLADVGRYPEIHFSNADRLAVAVLRSKLHDILAPGNLPPIDPPPPPKLPCPYRGLFHFGPNDAEFFFGRDDFVKELSQGIHSGNFIVVSGASGSGKSSVVLAGLVPKLQQKKYWQFTHFRPGPDPFHALALALVPLLYTKDREPDATQQISEARTLAGNLQKDSVPLSDVFARMQQIHAQEQILIIADQFEELYTLCPQESLRRKFLECLLEGLQSSKLQSPFRIVLVATMRATTLGNALSYFHFSNVLRKNLFMLGAMDRPQLLQVIENPAKMLGVKFEAGLSHRIQDAVANEPGSLPLLEFALTLLWEKRKGEWLTHAAYEEIGEIRGALVNYADDTFAALTPAEKQQARRIFLQLIIPGEETEDSPRVATKDDLGIENWPLIQKLADARLIVTKHKETGQDQEVVEIIHEALIQYWKQLRQWIEKDRESLLQKKRIEAAAIEWDRDHRNPSYLFQNRQLKRARHFLAEQDFPLSGVAKEFIQAATGRKNKRNGIFAAILSTTLTVIVLAIVLFEEDKALEERISLGEKSLFTSDLHTRSKRFGLNYFGKGEFDKAAEKFEQSRKSRADDSEALIYLNNARVANKNPLTIAVSVPIWNAPNVAQEMLRGVAQAQHNVNASTEGINGKRLQVMIVNDGNEPKIAERIAHRLVGDSKILAVVGHNSSDVSKKGAVVYQDHLVMITPTSFALDLKNLKEAQAGNYIFRSVYSYEVLVPDLANHIIKTLKTPNLLLCTDSDAYDQRGFGDEFSKYNEIKLTQIDCDLSNPDLDFEQVIEQGIKKGANSLFVAPQVNRIQEAIDLAKIAPGRLKLFGISTLYTMDTLKQDVEGLVLSVYWHPRAFTENKENRTFYETAKHLWGKDINITWRTAMAYDAAQVIIEGLKKIPSSQSPSREGLQKVLSNPEFKIEKATGPIQFSPSGERRDGKAFLMKVCPGKESGAGYDFVPFESSEPCQAQ